MSALNDRLVNEEKREIEKKSIEGLEEENFSTTTFTVRVLYRFYPQPKQMHCVPKKQEIEKFFKEEKGFFAFSLISWELGHHWTFFPFNYIKLSAKVL